MPDEYISREQTLALLKSLGSRDYRREKGTIQDAIKMISSAEYTPAADVAPVVHGRWIETPEGTMCSECDTNPVEVGDYHVANYRADYCPNCGARMDGAAE